MRNIVASAKPIAAKRLTMSAANLRPDPDVPGMLRRARTPRKVSSRPLLPLCSFSPYGDGREITLLVADKTLLYTWDGTEIRLMGRLPAEPILAVTDTPGVVRMLLRHSPDFYYTYGSDLKLTPRGPMADLPEIQFFATALTPLRQAVAAVKLSGGSTGNAGSQLTAADAGALTRNLLEAYDSLASQARSLGHCFQPLMVRYRMLDASGNTLAVGPTMLVTPPEGVNATDAVAQTSTDSMQWLGAGALTATAFRVGFSAPAALAAPWNTLVARMIVEVSDELDPVIRSSPAVHGVTRNQQSGHSTVTSRVPGLGDHTGVSRARFRTLASALAAKPMHTVAEYPLPFSGGAGAEGSTVVVDTAGIIAGSTGAGSGSAAMSACRRTFSAALAMDDITVLCNPRTELSRGWSPATFVARRSASASGEWRCAFSVKIADSSGERVICREVHGTGHAPEAFAPLLCYPSADAVSLSIDMRSGADCWSGTFPLTEVPGAGIAVYISHGLEPITLDRATVYAPSVTFATPVYAAPGVAEIHPSADLRRVIASKRVAQSEIHAVHPAPRSHSGWDFSRMKLLFFSNQGITLTTINATGQFHATSRIDRRPVRSAAAVAPASDADGASLAAVAGDDLVLISGQKARTLCRLADIGAAPLCGAPSLGYDPAGREFWVAPGGRRLWRVASDASWVSAAEIPGLNGADDTGVDDSDNPFGFALWLGRLYCSAPRGAWDLSDDARPGLLPVKLTRRYELPANPSMLRIGLFASAVEGEVRLLGDSGSEEPAVMLALAIDGELNAPVTQPLMIPRRRFLTACYGLQASGDLSVLPETFI